MDHVPARLTDFLDQNGIAYDVLRHPPDVRAREAALDTHTPDRAFAKTVFVYVDGSHAMAVLPASHSLSVARLRDSIGAHVVALAEEETLGHLCPDCEIGSAPPFGNLYGIPVYASPALAAQEYLTFNAGTHEHAIRMRYADYARLVQPHVAHMARHERPVQPDAQP